MPTIGTVTQQLTLKNSSGYSILPSWVNDLLSKSTAYTRCEVITYPTSTTPTTYTINGLAGTSPVKALVINAGTTDLTALGIASYSTVIPAGDFAFFPAFSTASNITLSVASGTGEVVVVLLD